MVMWRLYLYNFDYLLIIKVMFTKLDAFRGKSLSLDRNTNQSVNRQHSEGNK